MTSASEGEGVYGKADVVREGARILLNKSVLNADKGGGGKKSENVVYIINGSPLD